MTRDRAPLEHALDLAARGLSVFPVPRPRGGVPIGQAGDGKVPSLEWATFQTHAAGSEQIRAWFAVPMNLAVICGAVSGVVVVDADSPEALRWARGHLPYTPWQTKTAKGFHLWYSHPGVPIRNRARIHTDQGRLALDVRGDGGYVIAAPSLHRTGTCYERAGDWTVKRTQLPRFWIGWLRRPEQPASPRAAVRPTGLIIDRARRYLAAIPTPEIGAGSDTATFSAACRILRGFELSEGDTVALLTEWAGGRPGWTARWIADKVASAARYGTEPIGALR